MVGERSKKSSFETVEKFSKNVYETEPAKNNWVNLSTEFAEDLKKFCATELVDKQSTMSETKKAVAEGTIRHPESISNRNIKYHG